MLLKNIMNPFISFTFVLGFACVVCADTGGPYEAVPDLKEGEGPPVFQIPFSNEPLRFYLNHIPELRWNGKLHEPDSYTWVEIGGYHASFRVLGHVRGRRLYEVRYVSAARLEQGWDFADAIIILAKEFDAQPGENLFKPVYFVTGGPSIYDRRAEFIANGDKYGAVAITSHWSGTGPGRWSSILIRGTEEFEYERFTPESRNAERDDDDQAATAVESKSEDEDSEKSQSEPEALPR